MRYGRFEGHMCERHTDYLAWLWSSSDVSCLSSIGLPLRPTRNDPPSDQVPLDCTAAVAAVLGAVTVAF